MRTFCPELKSIRRVINLHLHLRQAGLAGVGLKKGYVLGEADDYRYNIISDPVRFMTCKRRCCICWGLTTSG